MPFKQLVVGSIPTTSIIWKGYMKKFKTEEEAVSYLKSKYLRVEDVDYSSFSLLELIKMYADLIGKQTHIIIYSDGSSEAIFSDTMEPFREPIKLADFHTSIFIDDEEYDREKFIRMISELKKRFVVEEPNE